MNIEWLNPRSPYIVGMFHDLCKIDLYATNEVTGEYIHKDDNLSPAAAVNHNAAPWMHLTEEEVLCIRYHMGAYEKDDWEYYDRAIRKYQTVLWTHTADMVASKVKIFNQKALGELLFMQRFIADNQRQTGSKFNLTKGGTI